MWMYKICQMCEKPYRPARSDSRFCSKACKQKAYRRRADCEVGSIRRENQRQVNIAVTKQLRAKTVICETCGRELDVSILHTNLMYCSAACKQKAYRKRKVSS